MNYIVQNIKLSIEASKDEALAMAKHRLLKFFPKNLIGDLAIYKTSIDARKKENILFVYSVSAKIHGNPRTNEAVLLKEGIVPMQSEDLSVELGTEPMKDRPVVVGFGPCGIFW